MNISPMNPVADVLRMALDKIEREIKDSTRYECDLYAALGKAAERRRDAETCRAAITEHLAGLSTEESA